MFDNQDDDEEEYFQGLYENGHWEWNDQAKSLIFIRDITSITDDNITLPPTTVLGPVEFRDDIDLIEQQRFRKRYQRKSAGEEDIVFLQDIKDVVLYTAPTNILNVSVINVLHLSAMDRFLRALILYFQYYLQIADEMSKRLLELEVKIPTQNSVDTETEFRDNLEDLRLLVAKEYCNLILGAGEYNKYHHMGPKKKLQSLSKREGILFECLLQISLQVVWLALGRKSFNHIEIEMHRIFKSQIFNVAEYKSRNDYVATLTPEERRVLHGQCLRQKKKINTLSPLMNVVSCKRDVDYKLFGLGVVKYPRLNPRLRYLEHVLIASEILFQQLQVTLGILGQQRCRFDIMLREIKKPMSTSSSSASFRQSISRISARPSRVNTDMRKSTVSAYGQKIYADISIPPKEFEEETLAKYFPTECYHYKICNHQQRRKWLVRINRLGCGRRTFNTKKYPNIKN